MRASAEMWEGLKIAWESIRANKMRSGLTTLGIVIGVVTVTLMGTAIEGLNRAFTRGISALGSDVLYVERFAWFSEDEWWRMRNRREITLAHARAVERQLTDARAVAPVAFDRIPIRHGLRTGGSVNVIGTSDKFIDTASLTVAEGRFLSPAEVEGARPVCVVGWEVAQKLFPNQSALGQRITLGTGTFEIIGVIEKRGSFLGMFSLDQEVQIPIGRFFSQIDPRPDLRVDVKVASPQQLEDTKAELRGLMRKLRRLAPGAPDDFAINQQDAFVKAFRRVGGVIASIGLFVTGLSLFVGGIGIMNIMFVSVAERTREIGIRKAIGAKRRTILLQFLIEAALICVMGGLLALLLAFPLTLALRKALPATLSPTVVGVAILVSLLTGVISGFMPAYRAARLDPVEALRSE